MYHILRPPLPEKWPKQTKNYSTPGVFSSKNPMKVTDFLAEDTWEEIMII